MHSCTHLPSYYMRHVTKVLLLLGIALLCILAACENESSTKVDLSKTVVIETQNTKSVLTYAYLPQYTHATSFERHTLLVEYLGKSLHQPIKQIFPDSFISLYHMIQRGEVDIAFVNPVIYAILEQSGVTLLGKIEELSSEPLFTSEIIVRTDNGAIATLGDCAGKRWIAVDPLSAGGFVFALGLFQEHGLSLDDFAAVDFASGSGGKQEQAVMSVYKGQYDFATVREGTLDLMSEALDLTTLRVVARTPAYPSWVFIARKDLDAKLLSGIQGALFALSTSEDIASQHILEQAHIHAIVPTKQEEYASIRTIMKSIRILDDDGQFHINAMQYGKYAE